MTNISPAGKTGWKDIIKTRNCYNQFCTLGPSMTKQTSCMYRLSLEASASKPHNFPPVQIEVTLADGSQGPGAKGRMALMFMPASDLWPQDPAQVHQEHLLSASQCEAERRDSTLAARHCFGLGLTQLPVLPAPGSYGRPFSTHVALIRPTAEAPTGPWDDLIINPQRTRDRKGELWLGWCTRLPRLPSSTSTSTTRSGCV